MANIALCIAAGLLIAAGWTFGVSPTGHILAVFWLTVSALASALVAGLLVLIERQR